MEEGIKDIQFEDLIDDVQTRIIYESGAYDVAKKYYESELLYHYIHPSCTEPISDVEVGRNIVNGTINVILIIRNNSAYYIKRTNSGYINGLVLRLWNLNGRVLFMPRNPLNKPKVFDANEEGISIRKDRILPYSNILLVPSSIYTIISKRSPLCERRIIEMIRDYVSNKYEELREENILECTQYLIMCMYDMNLPLDDIIPNYRIAQSTVGMINIMRREPISYPTFTITENEARNGLNELFYEIVMDNI